MNILPLMRDHLTFKTTLRGGLFLKGFHCIVCHECPCFLSRASGPRLNIKTVFPSYGDSHVKDKTVAKPSYLSHGDPYTGNMTSLYWDGPQVVLEAVDPFSCFRLDNKLCVPRSSLKESLRASWYVSDPQESSHHLLEIPLFIVPQGRPMELGE